jgi:hypothetical protein
MAAQSGADPGTGPAATQASNPPAKQPADELLCTICGLTACWTKPGASPKPAAPPTPAARPDADATTG